MFSAKFHRFTFRGVNCVPLGTIQNLCYIHHTLTVVIEEPSVQCFLPCQCSTIFDKSVNDLGQESSRNNQPDQI